MRKKVEQGDKKKVKRGWKIHIIPCKLLYQLSFCLFDWAAILTTQFTCSASHHTRIHTQLHT